MSKKVIIIGVDGLDASLLEKWADLLPNITNLKRKGWAPKVSSIFPPDSVPAWITIYTGLNPAEHGVITFINPDSRELIFTEVDNNFIKGKTFWDYASKAGKKVCLVFPYAIYPAYEINGRMACRPIKIVRSKRILDCYPKEKINDFQKEEHNIKLYHGVPSRSQLKQFINACNKRMNSEAKIGLELMVQEDWDLFLIYFSVIDAIQHTFWHYCNPDHPHYPGVNPYQNIIQEYYILLDNIIGEFLELAPPHTIVLIISDHGHGARPVKLVHINELLRQEGLLEVKRKRNTMIHNFWERENLKKIAFKAIEKIGIGEASMALLQKFPLWKRVFASPSIINWEKTVAYVSDLSAVKSYSYGGIILNRRKLGFGEYEEMREKLINKLENLKEPNTNEPLVKWVCRREDLYRGPFLGRYPDILLELKDGYGIGWSVGGDLITDVDINIQSGSHKRDSAVFIMSGYIPKEITSNMILLDDIFYIILKLLDLNYK